MPVRSKIEEDIRSRTITNNPQPLILLSVASSSIKVRIAGIRKGQFASIRGSLLS